MAGDAVDMLLDARDAMTDALYYFQRTMPRDRFREVRRAFVKLTDASDDFSRRLDILLSDIEEMTDA